MLIRLPCQFLLREADALLAEGSFTKCRSIRRPRLTIPLLMDVDQIAELLQPFLGEARLSSDQLHQLSAYLNLLLKWNAKINLTAIRDPAEIVMRHFGESLFAARQLLPDPSAVNSSAIDLGSGAGFPGLPLKIWAPDLRLTLIESSQKKATFLREAARTLALSGVEVLQKRAEDADVRADLVTLRAVERFEDVLPAAKRLVEREGVLALLIGEAQIQIARTVLAEVNWNEALPVPLSQNRVLFVGRVG